MNCQRTNQLMFKDLKKFQAELDKYNDVNYASKVEIDCAKAKGDLMSYKNHFEKSSNAYTQKINDLNQTISDMKKELCAHQETIIHNVTENEGSGTKLYRTRVDKRTLINFAKPEFLKKLNKAISRLYDIGCYNDNLALMLAPDSDETIRLEKERRSKLSDLIRPFDYDQLNNLYDLFVPQREKSPEQHYFPKMSKMSYTSSNKEFSQESFCKQTTLLEKRMNESIPWDQKCKSSKELFKIKKSVDTIFDGVECCKQTIAKRTYFGNIDRLSREYYYADHMNAILGVYTDLDEFTNLQCDYVETWEKCEHLEKELSKSRTMSKSFEALQKHAINLELDLQQCKEKIKHDKSFKENQSNVFLKEREQYFESVGRFWLGLRYFGARVFVLGCWFKAKIEEELVGGEERIVDEGLTFLQWHLFLSSRVPEACLEWHQKCSGVKTGDSASVVKPIRDRVKSENFTSLRTRLLFVLAEANVVSVNSYTVSGSKGSANYVPKGHVMTANDKGHVSFAKLVVSEPSRKSVNFLTLITLVRNGADVVVSLESIRAVSKRFANITYGFFLEKQVTCPVVANYWNPNVNLFKEDVGNVLVWDELHGVPMTMFNEYGLSSIATKFGALLMIDSYKSNTCMQSCGRSSYARAMIKLQTHVELKYTIVVAMLKLIGEGFHMCTIRVEY
ncbi:hypothetical protein Tco_0458325 [Tanacetum coccineum]